MLLLNGFEFSCLKIFPPLERHLIRASLFTANGLIKVLDISSFPAT